MSARATGSGRLSFGLVSIPFKTHAATSGKPIAFRRLHKGCGARLKAGNLCPTCNVNVKRSATIRGFEYERDRYVTITDKEFHSLESARTGVLEIEQFVPATSIDDLIVKRSQFFAPDKGGDRAYHLLTTVLRRADLVAVGRYAIRGRDRLVILRPFRTGLLVQECFFADEVRSFDDIDVDVDGSLDFKPYELELAEKLVDRFRPTAFDHAQYRNEWADRVRELVERKVVGEEITIPPREVKAEVIYLLEWLKKSVAEKEAKLAEKEARLDELRLAKGVPNNTNGQFR